MRIYYAHHQWKYGTAIEKYELDLIRSTFGDDVEIVNPSMFLSLFGESEEEIMRKCTDEVILSDILVFSSVDGVIGKGVYTEIDTAVDLGKDIYYICQNCVTTNYGISKIENPTTDRVYAIVKQI